MQMIKKAAVQFNGITIAYVMGFLNAALACLGAFGVDLTDTQQGTIAALFNTAMILAVHIAHRVGEVSPTPMQQQQQAQPSPSTATTT